MHYFRVKYTGKKENKVSRECVKYTDKYKNIHMLI